jgi:Flp pilus assembly secretin CpaC
VIGGSVTDQELRSTRGYPGVSQLPLLNSIMNTNSKDRSHNEILFVVTPYVIRKPFHDHGASAFWSIN